MPIANRHWPASHNTIVLGGRPFWPVLANWASVRCIMRAYGRERTRGDGAPFLEWPRSAGFCSCVNSAGFCSCAVYCSQNEIKNSTQIKILFYSVSSPWLTTWHFLGSDQHSTKCLNSRVRFVHEHSLANTTLLGTWMAAAKEETPVFADTVDGNSTGKAIATDT